jgi:hypothetical protein
MTRTRRRRAEIEAATYGKNAEYAEDGLLVRNAEG